MNAGKKSSAAPVRKMHHFINGRAVQASSGNVIERFAPSNGELISTWPEGDADDVNAAVSAAKAAYLDKRWSGLSAARRSDVLRAVSVRLKANFAELAMMESMETGKPLTQASDEVKWAGDIWDFAAGQARAIHGDSHSNLGGDKLAIVLREPVGVVGIITPWNYPLVVLSQKLPYALAAGCSVVVKPSELTSGTTIALARILEQAGLPSGVFNVVTGYGNPVGKTLAEHPDVDLISFTGSTATGKAIIAASAATLKRTIMELGGKNPNIIFADANLDAAVDGAIKGIVYNAGAECCSGSRLLVQSSIAEEFTKRLKDRLATVKVGDPMNKDSKVGAIVSKQQYEKILHYIEEGKKSAKLVFGGSAIKDLPGFFIEPTIFTGVTPDLSIAREEIFGPVMSVLTFDDIDDAARLANDTLYGLSSAIWTGSIDTALFMAREIRSGIVWVNTFLDVPSEVPIGGVRQSGFGRENGRMAIEEFCVLKTVVIQDSRTYSPYLG
ncbi:aldehyde dehydrogenase family protein [Paraburkholderia sp. BCC1885]|uniref:aldehyde dehydrogenase family protein n=1 Tax=Paraburkholderia sp. BCC1885 TaxID=2562669 RepID=UPI0011844B3A|nr:aldehyde dehydrogenase family protein [Paraburkholderia sp. BCC1885]